MKGFLNVVDQLVNDVVTTNFNAHAVGQTLCARFGPDREAYDDGFGNIKGAMVSGGSINYETGAIFITGGRPDAQFVVSANYGASQSGGNKFGAVHANSIANISARSTNSKIDTIIELIGLK